MPRRVIVPGVVLLLFGVAAAVAPNGRAGQVTGTWAYAQSPIDPDDVGKWVHLAGVWDADFGQIRLYVNGVLTKLVPRATSWRAKGPWAIGRTGNRVGGGPN